MSSVQLAADGGEVFDDEKFFCLAQVARLDLAQGACMIIVHITSRLS